MKLTISRYGDLLLPLRNTYFTFIRLKYAYHSDDMLRSAKIQGLSRFFEVSSKNWDRDSAKVCCHFNYFLTHVTALECGASSSPPEITYWYDKLTTTPPTHFLKVADPYLWRIKSTGRLIFKANLELKKFNYG